MARPEWPDPSGQTRAGHPLLYLGLRFVCESSRVSFAAGLERNVLCLHLPVSVAQFLSLPEGRLTSLAPALLGLACPQPRTGSLSYGLKLTFSFLAVAGMTLRDERGGGMAGTHALTSLMDSCVSP